MHQGSDEKVIFKSIKTFGSAFNKKMNGEVDFN